MQKFGDSQINFVDKKVVFREFSENFYAAFESEQSGIADYWGTRLRESFVKRGKGFCCEFEF